MSLFKKHLPALERLKQRVQDQEIKIEHIHKKAQKVVNRFEELETLIIKNFGQKQGERIMETTFKKELNFINSRISLNEFDEAENHIKKLEIWVKEEAFRHSGVTYH